MAKKWSFGSFVILAGLIVLLLQVTFSFEGSSLFYQYWWMSIIVVIIGALINLRFNRSRWSSIFSRETLMSGLAFLLETLVMLYFLKCFTAVDILSRVKFFLTAVILFFVTLHWNKEIGKSKVFF